MFERKLDINQIKKLRNLLDGTSRGIVITGHMSPDGDCVGSCLALARLCDAMGKTCKIVLPDAPLDNLKCLPGFKEILVASRYTDFAKKLFEEASVIFCLDFNSPDRVSILEKSLRESTAVKVLIDHHIDPETSAFDIIISRPEMCSTCYLLFRLICALELFSLIDRDSANCLLAGMMTDTGNLSYNDTDPEIYTVVSELLKKGADKDRLYRELFNTFSANCLMLNGYALSQKMEIFPAMHAALITLSRAELNKYHYVKGDTEGLVNKPLAIPGIVYSAFIREEEGYVKVSMRSVGAFPVNELCSRHFGGGGHKNAAGGEFRGSLSECADLFRSLLEKNKEEFLSDYNKSENK